MLEEDAKPVSEWADLKLTSRKVDDSERVPMVGFPFRVIDRYVEKIRAHQDVTLVQDSEQ